MFKTKNKWLLFGLLSFSIIVNIYFRLSTLFLSPFDKIAKENIYITIQSNLSQEISLRYPEMSDKTKKRMFNKLFTTYLNDNKHQIRQAINKEGKERKAYYQDERGWTYLLETDSYRWLRRIENYLNTKQFGTRRIGNQEYDDLEFAPQGDKIESSRLFFYSGVYFYKLLHMMNNKLSLANCLSLVPVILSIALILSVFWLCALFGISYWGSFLASLAIGLSPIVLLRTSFGWFDTDIYNLFMPLIIISVLSCSFRQSNSNSRIILIITGGILLGMYSSVWPVWWLIFYVLFIGIVMYELSSIPNDAQIKFSVKIKSCFTDIFLFVFSVYLSVWLISGLVVVKESFCEPLSYFSLRMKDSVMIDSFWPNLAFSVGELRQADIPKIILYVGGRMIFYGGIISVLVFLASILRKKKPRFKEDHFLLFGLSVWLLAALILTFSARRFVLFLITPLAVFCCAGIDELFRCLNQRQSIFGFKNNSKYRLVLYCIFISIAIIPLNNAQQQSLFSYFTFLHNDLWQNMLMTIKKETPPDAIINTDWTTGDLIMSIANRATIQDPHWQYNAVFFWFDYALLTNNEEEAFGIIRMINSGGNRAYEELLKILDFDKIASLKLIKKMMILTEEESRLLLNNYTRDKNIINKILRFIYGNSRPVYLVVHNNMLTVMNDISKIGNWDFKRADLWKKFGGYRSSNFKSDFINYAKNRSGYSAGEADSLYDSFIFTDETNVTDWISKTYKFYTNYSGQLFSNSDGKIILFDNGIVIDKDNFEAYFFDRVESRWISAGEFIFVDRNGVKKENINQQGDVNYSILFLEEGNTCRVFLFSSPLAQSIFFKLYFLNGEGLKHFALINHESDKTYGTDIYLYKVIK